MRIEINKEFQSGEFIKKNILLLKLQLRNSYILVSVFALIGFSLLIYVNLLKTAENTSGFGFELTFILMAFFILIQTIKVRNTSKHLILSQSKKLNGQVNYIFTDEGVVYSNMESELKCKWSCYTHFQLLGDYILITNNFSNWNYNSLMINKDDLGANSTKELIGHLRNLLIEKKK